MHSQRASSTFCWLPPDSSRIFCSGPEHLTPSLAMKRSTISRCLRLVDHAGAGQVRQQRQRQVLAHRHVGDDALDLAVLGAEAHAGGDRGAPASRNARSRPPKRIAAAVRPVGGEDRARRLGAARSRAGRRARRSRRRGPRADTSRTRRPTWRWSARSSSRPIAWAWPWKAVAPSALTVGEVAAEHGGDQLQLGHLGHRRDGDGAAVAHDRDPVADRVELVELVADEDHRHALALELADHVEQDRDLVLVERAGRLVHDHQLGLERDRAGDRHHLLDGGVEAHQRPAHVDRRCRSGAAPRRPRGACGPSRAGRSGDARGRGRCSRSPSGRGRG